MEIRAYRQEDIKEIAELFYNTVHTVNAADYTEKQLDAWADRNIDLAAWDRSFQEHMTLVAVMPSDKEMERNRSWALRTWTVQDISIGCMCTEIFSGMGSRQSSAADWNRRRK